MSARPLVQVRQFAKDAKDGKAQLALPSVFLAPIRPDIVHDVHTSMNKNKRQAYGVKDNAGMQHSAESWGTGRAVARIPRVSGGGNSRSGQGAFGNMCRKGRMFAPTKVWRKWHRKINTNQKRYAVASAIAASALPSLVLARGHKIEAVPEIPLVVDDSLQSIVKTKDAVAAFEALGAYTDVEKARDSRKIRAGVGKSRNRRHVQRRGPLVVYAEDNGVSKAFRALPGVEVASVDSLNLLQLAPGGHLGRFIVWTRGAFEKLHAIWGSTNRESAHKSGYHLPRSLMSNSDLTRIINSDEVQSKLRPQQRAVRRFHLKKNPLKNLGALVKVNPYALAARRSEVLAAERRAAGKAKALEAARAKKTIPLTKEEQKAAARDRAHEPQQRLNYLRLSSDEIKAAKPLKFKVQKPRPAVAPPAALSDADRKKKSESRKAKRAAKPKLEKKEGKGEAKEEKKLTRGQQVLASLLKSQAMQKVAKKKSSGGGGGKGGKKEKGKEAAKGDAKKGEKGKEAAKGDAKKEAGKAEAKKPAGKK